MKNEEKRLGFPSPKRMKNYIFDLDGTILNTIAGLRYAINEALEENGFPYRYDDEATKHLIGEGTDVLVHRALQDQDNPANFALLKAAYLPRYRANQEIHTSLFPGVKETLERLRKEGALLFVCTNKPDILAKRIVTKFYGSDFFLEIRGLQDGETPKPNPAIVNSFLHQYHLKPEETLFVGDSITDYETATNAKLLCGICLWGYGRYQEDWISHCAYRFTKPEDLWNTYSAK